MKEDRSFTMKDYMPEPHFKVIFNLSELKEYYKTIKTRNDITDSYKLRIANAIIDNS
jgi:hypothetical protein